MSDLSHQATGPFHQETSMSMTDYERAHLRLRAYELAQVHVADPKLALREARKIARFVLGDAESPATPPND